MIFHEDKSSVPLAAAALALAAALSVAQTDHGGHAKVSTAAKNSAVELADEKHLRNVKQLTFGGENAEAYFSGDGQRLIFQAKRDGRQCDQMYTMRADGSDLRMVSTGGGTTTCAYIFPSGKRVLFSSTHLAAQSARRAPTAHVVTSGRSTYVRHLHGAARRHGREASDLDARLRRRGHVSADGKKIVFTSTRDGDLDIYTMNADGTERPASDERRSATTAARSSRPTATKIVYRAHHPKTPRTIERTANCSPRTLIEPNRFELWVMDADGSEQAAGDELGRRELRALLAPRTAGASSSRRIITNPRSRNFDLYLVNLDGTGLERVTYERELRRLPDVLARRQETGLRLEPQRRHRGRHERLHRRLD